MVNPMISQFFTVFHSYLTLANWCRISQASTVSAINDLPRYQARIPAIVADFMNATVGFLGKLGEGYFEKCITFYPLVI